jgi:hypothetical protein
LDEGLKILKRRREVRGSPEMKKVESSKLYG